MPRPGPTAILLALLAGALATPAHAQQLRELEYEELDASTLVVTRQEQALLVVESTVPDLGFDSNRGVIEVEEPEPGVWRVWLRPGTQYVRVLAEGYLPLELPRLHLAAKEAVKLRVRAKPQFGALEGFDANRPELDLTFPDAGDEVYVQLDDNPPQRMDFSGGRVTLRPTPGRHTVKVYSGGRVWSEELSLEQGEVARREVVMSSARRGDFAAAQPGNLFVESDPPGARVFLNQVEQEGTTPLAINDLQPGEYQLEVVKDLYQPAARGVVIQPLEYTTETVELTPNFGEVAINSEPEGALVYLNGRQRGTTPLQIPRMNAGTYQLRLVQQLYHEATDTFSFEPGGGFQRTYELKPQFGAVKVTSEPSGATVEVDGVAWGTTPLTKTRVLSGRHVVRATKEHYYEQEKAVEVKDGQEHLVPFLLKPSVGFVTVTSQPSGAAVTLAESGRELGTTPLRREPLPAGTYTLRLRLEDHETAERSIAVVLGGEPEVAVDLARKLGHVRVESTPAGATVLLDGEERGSTPTVLKNVPTGSHTLRIEKRGYDPLLTEIAVRHNEITSVRRSLGTAGTVAWRQQRSRARLLALLPGGGQFASPGQWWRGVLYVGGIGAAGYLAWEANSAYETASDDFDASMDAYHEAVLQQEIDTHYADALEARSEMEDASGQLDLFLIAAGGVYAVSLLDAWFFGGGPRPQATAKSAWAPGGSTPALSLAPRLQGGRAEVGLSLRW